jgi:hypothetical protein
VSLDGNCQHITWGMKPQCICTRFFQKSSINLFIREEAYRSPSFWEDFSISIGFSEETSLSTKLLEDFHSNVSGKTPLSASSGILPYPRLKGRFLYWPSSWEESSNSPSTVTGRTPSTAKTTGRTTLSALGTRRTTKSCRTVITDLQN